jgi:hypothetical protein
LDYFCVIGEQNQRNKTTYVIDFIVIIFLMADNFKLFGTQNSSTIGKTEEIGITWTIRLSHVGKAHYFPTRTFSAQTVLSLILII